MKFWLLSLAIIVNLRATYANDDMSVIRINETFDSLDLGDSPLYQELENYFVRHYESISQSQLNNIEWGDDHRIWGGVNHIGLDYSKDFIDFSVTLKRQVAPDLFHDERYIVTDMMDIYIDASTLFEKLKGQGAIDITQEQLKAIAGLTFKRSYRFNHFADNYRDALTLNLDRLYFSFIYFRSKNFLRLNPGEFVTKEDYLGVYAGLAGSLPVAHGFSAHFGALAKYERLGKVELYAPLEEEKTDSEDDLRINYERSEAFTLGVTAGLMSDFLGLLRLTLLQYDFSYTLEKSYKTYLNFSQDEIDKVIRPDSVVSQAIGDILKHRYPELDVIAPYIVSEERRVTENKNTKYAALYWGVHRDQETSQVQIVKDCIVQSFFKHDATFVSKKSNILDWLLNSFLKAFAQVQTFIRQDSEHVRSIKLEYEHEENLLANKDELALNKSVKKLSLHFVRDFKEAIKGSDSRSSSDTAVDLLERYTGVDPYVIKKYEGEGFSQSLSSHIFTTFDEDGIRYFHQLSYSQLKTMIDKTCNSKSIFNLCRYKMKRYARRYISEKKSRRVYKSDVRYCNNLVRNERFRFRRYKKHKVCLKNRIRKPASIWVNEVPLWRLKDFFQEVLLRSKSKVSYFDYVGIRNVHNHGYFKSYKGDTGEPIQHYFKEGYFQGLGVINNQR